MNYAVVSPNKYIDTIPTENYFRLPAYVANNLHWKVTEWDFEMIPSPSKMYQIVKDEDVVHCHTLTAKMMCLYWLLRRRKCKLIITPHISFGIHPPTNTPLLINLALPLLRQTDTVLSISPHEHEYLKKRKVNSIFMGLAIDVNKFKGMEHKKGVLFFGGNRKVKGMITFVKAMQQIDQVMPNVPVTITECDKDFTVGNYSYRQRIKSGSPEYWELFKNHNVFVNASRMEGFSLGVAEAYTSGMKVCASDIPTIRSVYGSHIRYHKPLDYDKLADNIYEALEDKSFNDLRVLQDYELENWKEKLKEVYSVIA